MRIAVVGNFALSGKQTMVRRALPMAEVLSAAGHTVCMAMPLQDAGEEPGPSEKDGVLLRYVPMPAFRPGPAHLRQIISLFTICWRWRPAAVYVFKPIAYSGIILSLFWLLRVFNLYRGSLLLDTDDWEGHGGWNDKQPFPRWLKALIAWQENWSLRNADVVTAASRTLVDLARKNGAMRVVYVPNAVSKDLPGVAFPSESLLREDLGIPRASVVLVYTRFVEFQVSRLVDTLESILRRHKNAVLLVVGAGMLGEERELERMAAARGMERHIQMAGWLKPDLIASYLRLADVALYLLDDNLLNRSKCPVKMLELLAAGVPVVADRVGQAAEYISDGRTGHLVPPGDHEAMADAVVSLLRQPGRRSRMGSEARSDALSRLSWQAWGPEVERALLLSEAVAAGARTAGDRGA